ncbi:hypothetical protein DL95DRAFT_369894 [Leptodontidium sp. 2 PMI_412]|nr:hypothetical protein DL95DRAFT_369894 [Leptodontidium sp. 2 PMI_412]
MSKPPILRTPSHPLTLSFTTLDVFTSTPYTGNPLALIRIPSTLRSLITQQQKQNIAAEFNLSETIFLHEQLDRSTLIPEWDVEIFTTDAELPFAGHPVIGAAAYVLGRNIDDEDGEGAIEPNMSTRVSADIPYNVHIHSHTIGDLERPIPGLSLLPSIRKAELDAQIVSIVQGMTFLLVRLGSLEELGDVQLVGEDVSFHGVLDEGWRMGFVAKYYFVVLEGEGSYGDSGGVMKIRSRMLEVAMEDPATGSAASALSCYLALCGGDYGRKKFEVTQGVEMGRKSVIGVEVFVGEGLGQGEEGRRRVEGVRISGNAVVVMEGNLRV